MPRVKFDYIVSFSSEDPDNPASNLLAWEVDKKKWLCTKGEPSCSVVLQLNKAVRICSVNIGAHQAALVEVLVGRSETPNDPFQVLVPSSVFQTPGEARRAAPADADKVRSFGPEVLADTRLQRWDRLRVVCTQPYNKHCKFGLSFVHVYCEGESLPAPAPALPARLTAPLDLHSSDEEEFRPGELFAKHLRNPEDTVDTGAQIRQATSHALRNIPDSSIRLSKASIGRPPAASAPRASPASPASPACGKEADRLRDREAGLLYTADDDRPNDRVDRVVNKHNEQKRDERKNKYNSEDRKHASTSTIQRYNTEPTSTGHGLSKRDGDASSSKKDDGNKNERKNDTPCNERKNGGHPSSRSKDDNVTDNGRKDDGSRKRRHSDKKDVNDAVSSLCAGAVSSRPHTLLADVVFVLSGYENPRRADLRNTALALGASCRRDWGPGCTHLICAFPNTPKLRSVRAGPGGARAVAVRGEWVEETARTRRRLPWQWFATEDRLRAQPPPAWEAAAPAQDPLSECDTDDEIERVRQKMKRRDASPGDEAPAERVPAGGASPGDEAPAGGASPVPELDLSTGSNVTFVRDERVQGSVTVVDSDSCGGSTEEEDGAPPSPGCGGRLPALFAGRVFSIRASQARAALLRRYLLAYGGLVSTQEEGGEVDYVVCDPPHGAGEREAERGVRVRAAWVWRCHEARALQPPEDYLLAGS